MRPEGVLILIDRGPEHALKNGNPSVTAFLESGESSGYLIDL